MRVHLPFSKFCRLTSCDIQGTMYATHRMFVARKRLFFGHMNTIPLPG
jgi:hypothetical protein